MRYNVARLYVLLQVIGIVGFLTGLRIHILTYTKAISPNKKKRLGIIAVLQMIFGATLAMWPCMMQWVSADRQ